MSSKKLKLNHVIWALDPIRRKIEAGMPMLDDGALACLARLEMLVKRNAAGVKGDGCVYTDTGQKADKDWVRRRLARMNPSRIAAVDRNLTALRAADEVSFDKRGRPYLKHWAADKKRSKNSASEDKTLRSDEEIVSASVELLGWYLRSGEPRTVDALCHWLGAKLKKCPVRTMPRIVELLEAGGVLLIEDGVLSVSGEYLPSPPSAARPPPRSGEAGEQETEAPAAPETFPTEDIEPIAGEDFSEIPIDPIGGDAPNPASAGLGTASAGEGGGEPPKVHVDPDSPPIPVGQGRGSHAGRKSGGGVAGLPAVVPTPGGKRRARRNQRLGGFDRSLSGKVYRGWVDGTHPHPRRTKDELVEFRSVHVHDCDLIDGMLYLAPDGKPPNPAKEEGGQESLFKYALGRINIAAGGASAADDKVRRVLVEFVEDIQEQKRHDQKPFDCDASVLFEKLMDLEADLAGWKDVN